MRFEDGRSSFAESRIGLQRTPRRMVGVGELKIHPARVVGSETLLRGDPFADPRACNTPHMADFLSRIRRVRRPCTRAADSRPAPGDRSQSVHIAFPANGRKLQGTDGALPKRYRDRAVFSDRPPRTKLHHLGRRRRSIRLGSWCVAVRSNYTNQQPPKIPMLGDLLLIGTEELQETWLPAASPG